MKPIRDLRDDAEQWLEGELRASMNLGDESARAIASAVLDVAEAKASARGAPYPPMSGQTAVRNWLVNAIANTLACARSTVISPGGVNWWHGPGAETLEDLRRGDATGAVVRQGEALAGPFDVQVDFNWPGDRFAQAAPSLLPGSIFVGGDGEGNRARIEIIMEGGERTARVVADTFASPVGDLWSEAWREAAELMELDEATIEDAARWFEGLGLRMVIEPDNERWIARIFEGEQPRTEVYRYGPSRSRMLVASGAAQTYIQRVPPSSQS